jgi:hypothetical protein
MAIMTVEELYDRYVKRLPPSERLRLITMTAQDLAQQTDTTEGHTERSLLELEGLGAEIWKGIDAQDYVNRLREEWDHRP